MSPRAPGWTLLLCAAVALGVAAVAARAAQASVLRLRAPDQCVQAADVSDQVETLLGRPLAAVEGVDFEVEISRPAVAGKPWQLRLDRIERGEGSERSSRQLPGQSCSELADAAAVAIAMSIRASAAPEASPERVALPTPTPTPTPPASAPPSPVAVAQADRGARPRASLTLAVVADTGALPSAGVGGALEAALDLERWRFIGLGALFASQAARVGSLGGDFGLVFGALLACRRQALGGVSALGCAGGEVGRLAGQGAGLDAPRLGSALWLAPRAELGLIVPVTATWMLVGRAGAAVPLSRPVFVADQTVPIHQAHRVSARITLGLQLGF